MISISFSFRYTILYSKSLPYESALKNACNSYSSSYAGWTNCSAVQATKINQSKTLIASISNKTRLTRFKLVQKVDPNIFTIDPTLAILCSVFFSFFWKSYLQKQNPITLSIFINDKVTRELQIVLSHYDTPLKHMQWDD